MELTDGSYIRDLNWDVMLVISNVVRNDMPVAWIICCFVDQCVMLSRHVYVKVLLMMQFHVAYLLKECQRWIG